MDGKRCRDCGQVKPLDQFHRNSHRRDGRQGWCKECHNERARQWRADNPGYHAKRMERDPDYFRRTRIKARYGIEWEEYQQLREQQGGRCAICGLPCERLVVDHNHQTGRARALLCHACNAGLGWLENSAWLPRALAYLEAHREPPQMPRDGM
jgi:hypothetical protein